jgi:hypothetical protein
VGGVAIIVWLNVAGIGSNRCKTVRIEVKRNIVDASESDARGHGLIEKRPRPGIMNGTGPKLLRTDR